MKLKKAIEILTFEITGRGYAYDSDTNAAIKLGMEALRCLERLHKLPYGSPLPPLPGETSEEEG